MSMQWVAGGQSHGTQYGEGGLAHLLGSVLVPAHSQSPTDAPGATCGPQLSCAPGTAS